MKNLVEPNRPREAPAAGILGSTDPTGRLAVAAREARRKAGKQQYGPAMRDCTVSVTSLKDGQTHTVELSASSVLNAS